jgi:cell division protein FtsB
MALAGFALAIRNDLVQNSDLNNEKEAMKKSLREETSRQAILRNKLKIMNKNSYIELVAREKLGLIQRGEDPYKVTIK